MDKKKKKVCSSTTCATGSVGLNIDRFNMGMGSPTEFAVDPRALEQGFDGYAYDADCGVSGDGANGGGMGESLTEAQIFAAKMGGYVDLPDQIKLLDSKDVSTFVRTLEPMQNFTVGYITPIYFYKKLLDKFTLLKATELTGFTGIDARDAVNGIMDKKNQDIIDRVNSQTANAAGRTDYNGVLNGYADEFRQARAAGDSSQAVDTRFDPARQSRLNTENNRVKSYIDGMRKEYGDGEINKTVKQDDIIIYEIDPTTGKVVKDPDGKPVIKEVVTDLKTILFYPARNSYPKVRYFIDMKDGSGYFEISREDLVDIIYKRVFEVIARDVKTGAISDIEDMSDTEITFLENIKKKAEAVIASDAATNTDTMLSDASEYKTNVRALYVNQCFYLNDGKANMVGVPLDSINLTEELAENVLTEKRETKRYYIRPQDIFCANKADVLKALVDVFNAGENCTVYTLKNLSDHDDVHKLTNDDIIYTYDKGVLLDKNKVLVADYDLFIKHEEERGKVSDTGKDITKTEWDTEYDDRMTQNSVTESVDNPFELTFESYDAYGYRLCEGKEAEDECCICGEPIEGYGNNAEPYKSGTCCDACNLKFVIPARLNRMSNTESDEKED